jgi:hypothetical protein
MDVTTKVIIATLSGFIIAFFAEPAKKNFLERTKLHNLKIALYKELIFNMTAFLFIQKMRIILCLLNV